jgi:hypothetical protein
MSLMSDSRRLNEENTSVCIFLANSVGAKKFNPLDQAADSQLITFFMAFWKQLSSEKNGECPDCARDSDADNSAPFRFQTA